METALSPAEVSLIEYEMGRRDDHPRMRESVHLVLSHLKSLFLSNLISCLSTNNLLDSRSLLIPSLPLISPPAWLFTFLYPHSLVVVVVLVVPDVACFPPPGTQRQRLETFRLSLKTHVCRGKETFVSEKGLCTAEQSEGERTAGQRSQNRFWET